MEKPYLKILYMKKTSLLLLAALLAGACCRNEVIVDCSPVSVRLQVVSPEVVRVSVSPDGKFHDRQSLPVLPQKECTDFTVSKESSKVVLHSIAGMLNKMQKYTVSEGVETKSQLDLVDEIGCDVVQGFYFDKPLPYAEYTERLKKGKYELEK